MNKNPLGQYLAQGQTKEALFQAIARGKAARVQSLMGAVHTDARDKSGWTPVMAAAHAGNEELLKLVLRRFSAQTPGGAQGSALIMAARRGFLNCVRVLAPLSNLGAVNGEGATALSVAAARGMDAVAAELLPRMDAASIALRDKRGHTALMHAAIAKSASCVELLMPVSDLTAVNNDGLTALHLATLENAENCVDLLLRGDGAACAKMTRKSNGSTPLRSAMVNGQAGLVKKLAPFSDVSIRDGDGLTVWEALLAEARKKAENPSSQAALVRGELPNALFRLAAIAEALAPWSDPADVQKMLNLILANHHSFVMPVAKALVEGHEIRTALGGLQSDGVSEMNKRSLSRGESAGARRL